MLNSIPVVKQLNTLGALNKSQAVIEFNMDGTIIRANKNFLKALGYNLNEIKGKHHSMFVEPTYAKSEEYKKFWDNLNKGHFQVDEYKRFGKGGKEVWIQASYNPVFDVMGKPSKVVKFATYAGQIDAINKSQAVIEFTMDGTIITANQLFLDATGYSLPEIQGKHHSMFVDSAYKSSHEYAQFWESLKSGQFQQAEYKRFGKGGKEIWIQASYNPIMDMNGTPFKVVKYATDITKQKLQNADYAGQIEAIGKSQAVIEFTTDGIILNANNNFLNALGYSLDEIKGKHHSLFVDPSYKNSVEYKQFWDSLKRGEYQQAEYKRFGKGGKEIWIQASYNPIMDMDGKPFKVVKYATDVTQMVQTRTENDMGLKEAIKVLTGLLHGDLTQKMEIDYKGDYAQIKNAINSTMDRLYGMVKQIIESSQSVNTAAGEIAAGSTDLSERTEEQASSLEQTAASMAELTGTVKQNSENATQASQTSAKASELAGKGGDIVKRAVAAMDEIEKSSKKVSDIIGVIDEIAFQTNLLALNAAVEAARAGDAGKGFAVVASEVRALAGRSASASKEIKALIIESSQQVQTGAALVNEAGSGLDQIVESNNEVNQLISDIASATKHQSSGINEINTAISQMDEVTQQNAALVEENTAVTHSMLEQAHELKKLMSFFKLDGQERDDISNTNIPMIAQSKAGPKKAIAHHKPKAQSSGSDSESSWQDF